MAWREFWKGLQPGDRPAKTNELLEHEWTTLESLWRTAKPTVPAAEASEVTAIDELFTREDRTSGITGWALFNEAEQRVGALLTPEQRTIEFKGLLDLAAQRNVSGLARHQANASLFETPPGTLAEQAAAYLALLAELQSVFINKRFERRLRGEVAARLFRYGLLVLAIAVLPPLLLVLGNLAPVPAPKTPTTGTLATFSTFSKEPFFPLLLVASFGILGAYFSRAIAFQTSLAQLTFENVQQLYVARVLRMRLLYGAIGATIFYFIVRGGLVGGSLFPDISKLGIGEHQVWQLDAAGVPVRAGSTEKLSPSGLTILEPTLDMAKLLVWSFIAGFSERLVPDTLTKTEAQAVKSGGS